MLDIEDRTAWHFPRDEQGVWPGFYPADSEAAIAHLEELRKRGAEYLVLPASAMWWLDHYHGFAHHLAGYDRVEPDDKGGVIFALGAREAQRS